MKLHNWIAALSLTLTLCGCASPTAQPLQEVRSLAAQSARLGAFAELSERYRDTYKREKPYLSSAADARERDTDARRRAAYDDFISVGKSTTLYLQTLGKLAGASEYDLSDQITALGASIKAWPESGLDATHANAYVSLGRLLARSITGPDQEAAVGAMLRDGDVPFQRMVEAMSALLRYYSQTNENEKNIVLGLFDVELALLDRPRDQLLAALAKAHYEDKAAEYALIGRRVTLLESHLATLARDHHMLTERLGGAPAKAGNASVLTASAAPH